MIRRLWREILWCACLINLVRYDPNLSSMLTYVLYPQEVKVNGPDYKGMDSDEALQDFLERIRHYEAQYETLDNKDPTESQYSFMKIFSTGEQIMVHKHKGHIQSRVVYFLMNIHITPRTIYLTRHGETEYNQQGRIGGDSNLSSRGVNYAKALGKYVRQHEIPDLRVWTSWMNRTIQTATYIDAPQERWKALNEIDAVSLDRLCYAKRNNNCNSNAVSCMCREYVKK